MSYIDHYRKALSKLKNEARTYHKQLMFSPSIPDENKLKSAIWECSGLGVADTTINKVLDETREELFQQQNIKAKGI